MQTPLRVLTAQDVKQALSMPETIDVMEEAFIDLYQGGATVPIRTAMGIPNSENASLFMPVHLSSTKQLGVKVVTIFPENPKQQLPTIQALFFLMDATNGVPLAIMNGEYLTMLRTGAASGLATKLLAQKEASVLGIVGAGAQAETQLEAVCHVRPIEKILLLSQTVAESEQFIKRMGQRIPTKVEIVESSSAMQNADVICTATSALNPVLNPQDIKPGCHINGIGSYKPNMCEVPHEVTAQAKVVVDNMEGCLKEAGDLIQPIEKGLLTKEDIHGELGALAAGKIAGRTSPNEITFFKSVGNAVQDLATAGKVMEKALKLNLGSTIEI